MTPAAALLSHFMGSFPSQVGVPQASLGPRVCFRSPQEIKDPSSPAVAPFPKAAGSVVNHF